MAPEIVLIALASLLYLAGTFTDQPCRCWFWAALAILGIAGAILAVAWFSGVTPLAVGGSDVPNAVAPSNGFGADAGRPFVVTDSLAMFGRALALLTGLALVLLSDAQAL